MSTAIYLLSAFACGLVLGVFATLLVIAAKSGAGEASGEEEGEPWKGWEGSDEAYRREDSQ